MIKIFNEIKAFNGLLQAEYLKTRKTWAFWLSVLGGLLIPAIMFLVIKSQPGIIKNPMHPTPWLLFLKYNWQSVATFLLPLFLVLLTSLVVQTEHRANALKKMLTLPNSRATYYWAKLLVIIYYTILTHIVFAFSIIVFGLILGSLVPETQFLDKPIPLVMMSIQIVKSILASLGIIAIQFLISLQFKNFIKPIGFGFATTLAGSIMLLGWEYVDYWPWSLPAKVSPGIMSGGSSEIFTQHEWISIGYFLVISILGTIYFSRKNIK
ncbi:MAG: ABC transporter permease [Salinivirgaceae bacterium]|jgi:hypothetical protein|nr:ABC transporter permease [Salinivirgaceae bacterium]